MSGDTFKADTEENICKSRKASQFLRNALLLFKVSFLVLPN